MRNVRTPRIQPPLAGGVVHPALLAEALAKAAANPSTWRWWVDGILEAQRQAGPVTFARQRKSPRTESTFPSGKPKTVIA